MTHLDSQNRTPNALRLRIVNPKVNKEDAIKFAEGHTNVLRSYNIPKVGSEDLRWMKLNGVYLIILEDFKTGEFYGGTRLEILDGIQEVPMIKVLGEEDENIEDWVMSKIPEGVAEKCGLWTSRTTLLKGASEIIIFGANVAARILKLKHLVAFCSPFIIKRFLENNWSIETSLGQDGYFFYPNEHYKSAVMMRCFLPENTPSVPGENEVERNLLKDYSYTRIEQISDKNVAITFDFSALKKIIAP